MGFGYVGRHAKHRRLKLLIRVLLILLLVFLSVWGFLSPKLISTDQQTLPITIESGTQATVKIVYVSDIHMGRWPYLNSGDVNKLITSINRQNADLVILGGDYANDPSGAEAFFRQASSIRATYGVFAVLGECDRGSSEQLYALLTVMRQRNITPLVNEKKQVHVKGQDLVLVGLDDVTNGEPALSSLAMECKSDDYVILLAHNPSIIEEALNTDGANSRRDWFDLGLFGHTHGGQILSMSGMLGIPKAEGRYVSGWYSPTKKVQVLVSNGVGTSGFPMRLGHAPQYHVVTLSFSK